MSKLDDNERSLLATCVARDRCWLRPNHCWSQEIAAVCERSLLTTLCSKKLLLVMLCSKGSLLATSKADGSRRSLLAAFVQQEIAVGYNQGRWQGEIAVGHDQIGAGRNQGRWLREIAAGSISTARDRC
ncbi:hypothetical protein B296_00022026 [Ensete ventricosum]|uniref:Uncharacterized protein n=1 Tax=Ensete ventricosum TaxID=4639 RepID=A0A427AGT5_ENSVE|nr:hypothetical protein B296_00022026 [Ensete ventricosum]